MNTNLPDDRQIWLRAFYGFGPEDDGFFGFTHESDRKKFLDNAQASDLVLIYGATDKLTNEPDKKQALGFLEVTRELCTSVERSSPKSQAWVEEHGFEDRWNYGLKVSRAWRLNNRVHIRNIAPHAYDNKYRFERTTRGVLLTPDERALALSHTVKQTNVFGEPAIPELELAEGHMENVLKPSSGIRPSFGERSHVSKDSETDLYLMILSAGAETLLGETGSHVGQALVKVGRSNNPRRRLEEINAGFPKPAMCRWNLLRTQSFPDANTAHDLEDKLKSYFDEKFQSQDGEFFTGDADAVETAFQGFCVANMSRILSAPGKAEGVR